jgi:hypothetical protein
VCKTPGATVRFWLFQDIWDHCHYVSGACPVNSAPLCPCRPGGRPAISPEALSPAPTQRGATLLRHGTASAGNMSHEVDAFSSVQDMIHAAILTYGTRATLREVSSTAVVLGNNCTVQQRVLLCSRGAAIIKCCCVTMKCHQTGADLLPARAMAHWHQSGTTADPTTASAVSMAQCECMMWLQAVLQEHMPRHCMPMSLLLRACPPCWSPASQIYQACEKNGRILFHRTGGFRVIVNNEHWKSQIRHTLYTSGRFVRCSGREQHAAAD